MPDKSCIDGLRERVSSITMTTAHLKYTSQHNANKYGVPVKHISTYLSFRDYEIQSHCEKRDTIIYSVDPHFMKDRILRLLRYEFPGYDHVLILGFNYENYLTMIRGVKFAISFGEGLDNYFIEACFTGGMGFTVYNTAFMSAEFLELDNVFTSYPEMERSLPSMMRRIESDAVYRSQLWRKNFDLLSNLYDDRIYSKKIREFLNGSFDFKPSQ
jgi:hypothetical protein